MIGVVVPDVVFVLVGTSHAGNIGAAARAMKTMGFTDLRLVQACDHLDDVARARATGAEDVLERATVHTSLSDAVADRHAVIGTTARQRHLAVPIEDCRALSERLGTPQSDAGTDPQKAVGEALQVALVFGRERSGLKNEEIDLCSHLVQIPCNPEFSSLNLGSAVQVMAYEWGRALQQLPAVTQNDTPAFTEPPDNKSSSTGTVVTPHGVGAPSGKRAAVPATTEAMQHFFVHLERVMIATGFLDPEKPRHLMRRLRRYFERNRPSVNELAILRGVLSATEQPRIPGTGPDPSSGDPSS